MSVRLLCVLVALVQLTEVAVAEQSFTGGALMYDVGSDEYMSGGCLLHIREYPDGTVVRVAFGMKGTSYDDDFYVKRYVDLTQLDFEYGACVDRSSVTYDASLGLSLRMYDEYVWDDYGGYMSIKIAAMNVHACKLYLSGSARYRSSWGTVGVIARVFVGDLTTKVRYGNVPAEVGALCCFLW